VTSSLPKQQTILDRIAYWLPMPCNVVGCGSVEAIWLQEGRPWRAAENFCLNHVVTALPISLSRSVVPRCSISVARTGCVWMSCASPIHGSSMPYELMLRLDLFRSPQRYSAIAFRNVSMGATSTGLR
jgi:hypothetical protein